MTEPQPSNVQEGADPPDVLPANAEDRKAAQALSSLDAKADEDGVSQKKNVDYQALNDAMKRLEVGQGQTSKPTETKKEEPKKIVKVDQADVILLVRELQRELHYANGRQVDNLDINKVKATELLKAHDANPIKAIKAWITTST